MPTSTSSSSDEESDEESAASFEPLNLESSSFLAPPSPLLATTSASDAGIGMVVVGGVGGHLASKRMQVPRYTE